MHLAILSGGDGWHVRDLRRAAEQLGHTACVVDFRRISAGVAVAHDPIDDCDAVIVRTMPPGSLEQVVFRMDVLHRLEAAGKRVLNPPLALEICVDKYLATAKLQAAGLRVPLHTNSSDHEAAVAGGRRPQLNTGGRTWGWCRGAMYKNPEPKGALSHLWQLAV